MSGKFLSAIHNALILKVPYPWIKTGRNALWQPGGGTKALSLADCAPGCQIDESPAEPNREGPNGPGHRIHEDVCLLVIRAVSGPAHECS